MIRPDKIIRSDRKTLSISVDPFGRLIVRAPKKYGEERIFAFLRQKEGWIRRKQAERQGAGVRLPPEELDGYGLLLLGRICRISLTQGNAIGYDHEASVLYLPEKNAKTRLVRWLKENAERILKQATERTAARMGATYRSVTVGSAKGRWGSCTFDDRIRYSFRLIYAPKEVVEYVIVHELAHTKHKNHSKAFWSEVEKYVPDWKEKRAWLKTHGGLMEVF